MANLSDLQSASLLEEIAYAMRAGTPVVDSMRRLETRRLGSISRAARTIAEGLDRGQSIADSVAALGSSTSFQIAAAIGSCEASGDPGLIEKIAIQLRRRFDLARETRLAWFYPWLLLAVGYSVAVLVMAPLIRNIQGRDFQWDPWLVSLAAWLESNWWLPPVVVAVLLVCFFVWLSRREQFSRNARLSLFCLALADQVAHGVPEHAAITVAAEMSGDRELKSIPEPSLDSAAVAQVIATTQSLPLLNASEPQTLAAQLRYKGAIFSELARRQAYFWTRLVPRSVMIIVGSGITLSYVWWVIAPVYRQVAQW